jgi:Uma2 family endonuclease
MVNPLSQPLTLVEFLALPETKPASEYIDGQVIQKPMPQGKHSAIQGELVPAINQAVKPEARAFPELRCTYPSGSRSSVYGGRSLVPDVAVFIGQRIPREENGDIANTFSIPPDWTIEILSPDQSQTKVTKNILHCLTHGTLIGWLIDPHEQTVFVYGSKAEIKVFDQAENILPVPDFAQNLSLTIKDLFAWLK